MVRRCCRFSGVPTALDPELDFNILLPRNADSYERFTTRFGLEPIQAHQEVVDYEQGKLLFETDALDDLFAWLTAHPDTPHTLYLKDDDGWAFMFSHLPHNIIWSVPYELLDDDALVSMCLREGAICGWGSWNEPPPDNVADLAQAPVRWKALKRFEIAVLHPDAAS